VTRQTSSMIGTPILRMFLMMVLSASQRSACWHSLTTFSCESPVIGHSSLETTQNTTSTRSYHNIQS